MPQWLRTFFNLFRFVSRARARAAARRQEERDHQLALFSQLAKALEVITDGSAKQAEENTKAINALAKSSTAQAESFSTWLKSFQIASPPESSVVRDEDELLEEEARVLDSMPEEFRLAYQLRGSAEFIADVKKDLNP